MSYMQQFSTKDLEEELERRKKFLKKSPKPLGKINCDSIVMIAEKILKSLYDQDGEYFEEESVFFDTVMTAVYGDDIFDWIRENCR